MDPDPLVVGVLDGIEHRFELGTADVVVELFRKGLDIDVHPVEVGQKGVYGFVGFVPAGDVDVLQTRFVGEFGGVIGVLKEDDRLVVGVGDGVAVVLFCKPDDIFGAERLPLDLVVVFLRIL